METRHGLRIPYRYSSADAVNKLVVKTGLSLNSDNCAAAKKMSQTQDLIAKGKKSIASHTEQILRDGMGYFCLSCHLFRGHGGNAQVNLKHFH